MTRSLLIWALAGAAQFCALASASAQSPAPAPQGPAPVPSAPPDSEKYGVFPIAYRELITRWLQERLTDPASAKIEWTEPRAAEIREKNVKASGYTVDFRINSRNKFGTYTGFQKHRVLIRNGEIIWADRVRE